MGSINWKFRHDGGWLYRAATAIFVLSCVLLGLFCFAFLMGGIVAIAKDIIASFHRDKGLCYTIGFCIVYVSLYYYLERRVGIAREKIQQVIGANSLTLADVIISETGKFQITEEMLRTLKKEGIVSKDITVKYISEGIIPGIWWGIIQRELLKTYRVGYNNMHKAIGRTGKKFGLSDEQIAKIQNHPDVLRIFN